MAARICDRLALGESLLKICNDDDMPGLRTVHRWLAENDTFSAQYSRARETQADTLADRVLDRADAATNEDAAAVRVYLDSVKWFAGVVAPRKYTPKHIQDITANVTVTTTKILEDIRERARALRHSPRLVASNGEDQDAG
jgi:hypothetical protein